ncbi:MAG: cytochrome c biogenesis protein CcdA [Actinobacteria bacterium]|nr:MAG: cytochrome c biogenesis protein CcdA [Actinomycetota bacterium]
MIIVLVASAGVKGALLGPVGFIVALFVGTVSFFSPCILPLLPGYLSFVSGLSGEEAEQTRAARRRTLLGIGLFVLGFATMFTALGIAASFVGGFLLKHLAGINRIAGAVVIVMGLAFVIPGLFPFLERERRPFLNKVKPGVAGAYPLGLAFAAGWTPCVGPGLGVLLTLGLTQGQAWRAGLLLFFFSMGFGIWFLLAGLGLRRAFTASKWLRARLRIVQAIGGLFMIAIGVLLITDQWNNVIAPLQRLINRYAPPI